MKAYSVSVGTALSPKLASVDDAIKALRQAMCVGMSYTDEYIKESLAKYGRVGVSYGFTEGWIYEIEV